MTLAEYVGKSKKQAGWAMPTLRLTDHGVCFEVSEEVAKKTTLCKAAGETESIQQTEVFMTKEAQYSFETPPKPIPESQIAKTRETEVVVVGAGTAGLVCANAAAEHGARVILISASSFPVARGGSNHAINTKLTRELGVSYNVGKEFKKEFDRAGCRIDQDKWFLFARKSGEAMDWLIDKMVAAGLKPVLELNERDPDDIQSTLPGAHGFIRPNMKKTGFSQMLVVKRLADLAKKIGVQIFYDSIAEQLVRDNDNTGRVTAVIARDPEGRHIKYIGTKAVVLATGDFTKDKEMLTKYCPEVLPLVDTAPVNYSEKSRRKGGVYAGDGHKMGLWVGAAWQRAVPNAPIMIGGAGPEYRPYSGFKGLMVNAYAERFCSEDVKKTHAALMQLRQPGMKVVAIWNKAYAEQMGPWYPFGSFYGSSGMSAEKVLKQWEKDVDSGEIKKADSIEDLALHLGLPPDRLKATVDRYNGFCESGEDTDFYKRPDLLVSLQKGPYYGQANRRPWLLVVSGGLRCNTKMQVLDAQDQIIPGLYVVGTIVGDMFANYYSFLPSGINYGALCITFGYLVGKDIATSV